MQYRNFGRLDFQVSALGFGAMRLPTHGKPKDIDEKTATRMVRYAIDHGVNYVDTAYPYHEGESENWLGRALGDGYREKVKLATKLPTWKVETAADFDRFLNEQLKKLRTEHIDFYLLHALDKARWPKMRKLDAVEWGQRVMQDGRIGYLGFSFHDEYKVFEEIVDSWDWPFCQIQYNYMDIRNQAGVKGLKRAASKGTAVVVMEPILGGRLVFAPEPVRKIWERSRVKRSPVDWALQWLWNQPEVAVVLSGMSTLEQVKGNLQSAEASGVGNLFEQELDLVREVRKSYEKLSPIPCTRCGYCMPCPHGVNIPDNLTIYNQAIMYENAESARREYTFIPEAARASACTQCRECEEKCPQKILISEWMPQVHASLGEGEPFKS